MVAGRDVRGRTRAGRLSSLDAWLVASEPALLAGASTVLDVGYGVSSVTVDEFAQAVHGINAQVRVIGVERDPSRVGEGGGGYELRQGDFQSLAALAPVSVVRAMNVLRGYQAEEVAGIHALLAAPLHPGALLVEGSSDVEGSILTAHLFRRERSGLTYEALLLFTDFSKGFSPWVFRDHLPRDLRRSVKRGTRIYQTLSRWDDAVAALGSGLEPASRFSASLDGVEGVLSTEWERAHGFARLTPDAVLGPATSPSGVW